VRQIRLKLLACLRGHNRNLSSRGSNDVTFVFLCSTRNRGNLAKRRRRSKNKTLSDTIRTSKLQSATFRGEEVKYEMRLELVLQKRRCRSGKHEYKQENEESNWALIPVLTCRSFPYRCKKFTDKTENPLREER
jgi:hypothetical protein